MKHGWKHLLRYVLHENIIILKNMPDEKSWLKYNKLVGVQWALLLSSLLEERSVNDRHDIVILYNMRPSASLRH